MGTSRERQREYAKKYYQEHKEKKNRQSREQYLKRPLEHNARSIVRYAIYTGKIVKQPCEICGVEPAEAHHDDYNKPLEVRWLCSSHHKEWHLNNEPIRPTEKRCIICGKEITVRTGRRKYCSDECKHTGLLKRCREQQRKNYIPVPPKDRVCAVCGKQFKCKTFRKYCSEECFMVVRKKQKREERERNKTRYREYLRKYRARLKGMVKS